MSLSICFGTGNAGDGSETHLGFENGKTESLDYIFFVSPLGLILAVTVTRCTKVRYWPLQVTCHGPTQITFFPQQNILRPR